MSYFLFCLLSFQSPSASDGVWEQMTVTYKSVRVHVTDKDGKPVKGLNESDFALNYNNAAPEHFSVKEVDDQTKESGEIKQYAMIFLDSGRMSPARFKDAIESARQIVADLTPKSRVGISHLDGNFQSVADFSTDKEYLLQRLDTISYKGSLQQESSMSQAAARDSANFYADAMAMVADGDDDTDKRFRTLQYNMQRSMRKASEVKNKHFGRYFLQMRSLSNMMARVEGDKSLFLLTGGQFSNNEMEEKLAKMLNGAEITMYSLLFDSARTYRFSEAGVAERSSTTRSLMDATRATGGFAAKATRSAQIRKKLAGMLESQSHYYRIAFSVVTGPDGQLDIKVPNHPELKLLYGGEILEKVPYNKLGSAEQRLVERTMLLESDGLRNDLGLGFKPVMGMTADGGYKIALVGVFGEEKSRLDRLNIMVAATDIKGKVLDETYGQLANLGTSPAEGFYEVILTNERPHKLQALISDPVTGDHTFFRFPGDGQLAQTIPGRLAPLHRLRAAKLKPEAFEVPPQEWDKFMAELNETERAEAQAWLENMRIRASTAQARVSEDPLNPPQSKLQTKSN